MVFGLVRDDLSTTHRLRSFSVITTTHGDDQTRRICTGRVWGWSHARTLAYHHDPAHPDAGSRRLPLRHQNPVFEVWPTATCHITAGYRLRLVGTALKVTNHPHPFNPPKALFLVVVVGGGRGLWWAVRVPVVNPATRRPEGNVRPHQPASFSHNTRGLAALMVKNYANRAVGNTHSAHQSDPCNRQNPQFSTHLTAQHQTEVGNHIPQLCASQERVVKALNPPCPRTLAARRHLLWGVGSTARRQGLTPSVTSHPPFRTQSTFDSLPPPNTPITSADVIGTTFTPAILPAPCTFSGTDGVSWISAHTTSSSTQIVAVRGLN